MSQRIVNTPVFNVYPQTGFQIRKDIPIDDILRQLIPGDIDEDFWGNVWEYAVRQQNEVTESLRDNVAVHPEEDAYWICVPDEFHGMFFRLRKDNSGKYWLDLAINTHLYPTDRRSIGVCNVPLLSEKNLKDPKDLIKIAEFQVLPGKGAQNSDEMAGSCILGDLVIDFGNTGVTAGFIHEAQLELLPIDNPWDPCDYMNMRDNDSQRQIFHSNQLLFRLESGIEPAMQNIDDSLTKGFEGNHFLNKLWWISGERACEMAKNVPVNVTYLFSPKKYIRKWKSDEPQQPTITLRGMNQIYYESFKSADIVKETLRSLLKMIIASFVNPHFSNSDPVRRPLINRIILTYPLTWRSQDKQFFKDMFKEIAMETIPTHLNNNFAVEMSYYNEPYCVMGYLVSEIIHQFGGINGSFEMVRSIMGNFNKPDDDSRILIFDIGGGSTDIALVDVALPSDRNDVRNCCLDLKATMRFNRAGDRISHIISTAIWEHIRKSRNISYALSSSSKVDGNIVNDKFRRIVRKLQLDIMQLSENVKKVLARGDEWRWRYPNEKDSQMYELQKHLLSEEEREEQANIQFKNKYINNINVLLDIACGNDRKQESEIFLSNFAISNDMIRDCIEKDRQGLYTVFSSLKQLFLSLKEEGESLPDRVILSGRTAKLPCMKKLLEEIFDRFMPSYRITSLEEFLPKELRADNHKNIEKLAVLLGVNAFRTKGNLTELNIEPGKIHRYVGPVVRDAERGCQLMHDHRPAWYTNRFVQPGDDEKSTFTLFVRPNTTVEIGQSYSEKGFAEVLGSITVNDVRNSNNEYQEVSITVVDDLSLDVNNKNVIYSDVIPGVTDTQGPVDHFCHDGKMDYDGSISEICREVFKLLK